MKTYSSKAIKGKSCLELKQSKTDKKSVFGERIAVSSVKDDQLKHQICEQSDNEEAECVPNGIKAIECFICGQQLSKIYKLRQHMQTHANKSDISNNQINLEKSSIYSTLNPYQRNIETRVIQDFLDHEIKEKRYSQFYGILSEAGIELHISDSETESETEIEKVIPRNIYKCDLCQIHFERRYKALFHQKTIHARCNLDITCDYCGRQFIGMQLLIHHLKTQCESDEKPITCTERFKQYLVRINIEQFDSLAEARKELKMQRLTTASKIFNCHVCAKTFTRSEHLTRHKAVHLPEESKFECPVCFRRFNRKDNMRTHMKVHMHEAERDSSATSQPILCQYCGHCFTSKSNYVVHMRRHTGEKPYKCDVCGKGFPKSTDLNSHKITHSGERNFICNICNKSFARSAVLSKHMRVHAGPFHCNLCAQSFPRPNELATHLRTHINGGRACTCIICNCSFHSQQQLEEHFLGSGHDNVRAEKERTLITENKIQTSLNDTAASNMFESAYNNDTILKHDKESENVSHVPQYTAELQSELSLLSKPFLNGNPPQFPTTQINIYGPWQ